uniref:Uncharacterized protein n=1 Tax=Anguilla anguilla TaxID=7936 RepID=A0A0E9QM64_ANGAN
MVTESPSITSLPSLWPIYCLFTLPWFSSPGHGQELHHLPNSDLTPGYNQLLFFLFQIRKNRRAI